MTGSSMETTSRIFPIRAEGAVQADFRTDDLVFLSLHGGGLRNRIRVSLDGEKAVCNLGGLSVADGEERMDYDIVLTHQVPGCRSNQLFKTILSDRSQARFDGLIKVVPDAQAETARERGGNPHAHRDGVGRRALEHGALDVVAQPEDAGAVDDRLDPLHAAHPLQVLQAGGGADGIGTAG